MVIAGLGLRAQKGGAVAVGMLLEDGEPRLMISTTLSTHADDDALSFEPYRIAFDRFHGPQGGVLPDAAAIVEEGRRRQAALAAQGLRDLVERLSQAGGAPVVAGLLVNRAGWITDLLEHSLGWPDHVPVAEGLAVREALRHAARACGVDVLELDEKSLSGLAGDRLRLSPAELDARLKALGAIAGRPWRKEQKAACLAAWIAASG